jgi:hypothetical protein
VLRVLWRSEAERWSPTPEFTHTKLTKKWLTFLEYKTIKSYENIVILKQFEKVNWGVNWLTFFG